MHLTNAIVAAIFLVLGKYASAICPAFYTDLGTGCYRFSAQEQLTWDQAYFICQLELNGYLVEIESSQEQNNLDVYLNAVIDPEQKYALWTGATDKLSEGTFRWMTSGNVLTYTAWQNGQPDDADDNEDCVYLKPGTHDWVDVECENRKGYEDAVFSAVCETDKIE